MKSKIIGLCAALSITACSTSTSVQKPESNAPVKAAALSDYRWTLVSAYDANHRPINDLQAAIKGRDALALSFDAPVSRVSITNACNAMSAATVLQGDVLQVGLMMSTKMACMPELMARERAVSQYLKGDMVVRLSHEHDLTLQTQQGAQLLFKGTPTSESLYGKSTRLFLEVAPQTKPCHGMMPMNCLYVRPIEYNEQGIQTHAGEWTYFYDGIEGYTHQAGQSSVLRINRYERPSPVPADASSYIYKLDMVVSQSTQ